jgi:hypothetical protein
MVQPAPRPAVVVVDAPPPITTEVVMVEPLRLGWGVHGHIGGSVTPDVYMGGATGALRLRPNDGHLAVELGIGTYAGEDYNGLDRVEVPLTVDVLAFANPDDQLQVYGLLGVGMSFAHVEGFDDSSDRFFQRDYAYFGGEVGLGLELRLSENFALNGDVRGFLRERVDDAAEPEFVERDDNGRLTGRITDTSGGALVTLGGTLYF